MKLHQVGGPNWVHASESPVVKNNLVGYRQAPIELLRQVGRPSGAVYGKVVDLFYKTSGVQLVQTQQSDALGITLHFPDEEPGALYHLRAGDVVRPPRTPSGATDRVVRVVAYPYMLAGTAPEGAIYRHHLTATLAQLEDPHLSDRMCHTPREQRITQKATWSSPAYNAAIGNKTIDGFNDLPTSGARTLRLLWDQANATSRSGSGYGAFAWVTFFDIAGRRLCSPLVDYWIPLYQGSGTVARSFSAAVKIPPNATSFSVRGHHRGTSDDFTDIEVQLSAAAPEFMHESIILHNESSVLNCARLPNPHRRRLMSYEVYNGDGAADTLTVIAYSYHLQGGADNDEFIAVAEYAKASTIASAIAAGATVGGTVEMPGDLVMLNSQPSAAIEEVRIALRWMDGA